MTEESKAGRHWESFAEALASCAEALESGTAEERREAREELERHGAELDRLTKREARAAEHAEGEAVFRRNMIRENRLLREELDFQAKNIAPGRLTGADIYERFGSRRAALREEIARLQSILDAAG